MRRPQQFRERDAARAIRVVRKAGLGIGRIEIELERHNHHCAG